MSIAEARPSSIPEVKPPPREAHAAFAASAGLLKTNMALGRSTRVIASTLTSLVTLVWMDWTYVVSVIGLLAMYEYVYSPFVMNRIVLPRIERAPAQAHWIYAVSNLPGGTAYAAIWAPVMATGGVIGALVGVGWFWGSLVHNSTYFSRDRLVFIFCMIPPVTAAIGAPFLMGLSWWGPWLAMFLTLQGLVAMVMAAKDRNGLAIAAEWHQKARHAAEEASVAKSQFLATMSHELRTPLNAIIGYSEILEEDLEDKSQQADPDDARRIRRAARHLLTLINEVLDLSKIESGRLELINGPVDIDALLRDVEETVRPIGSGNGNRVVFEVVGAIPMLDTDGARLKQCLLNLATNACKFTKDGRVTVRAGLEMRNGVSMLEVVMVDTGIGIKPEDQVRLFSPFIQVDGTETRAQDGTGLGLVITRKLAQAMGGDVSMISTAGVGSTFTLTIRATPIALKAVAAAETGPTVLVIEDDPTARDLTCRALTRLSFNVRATASASEGLALLAEQKPDLVILDIHLPDMSGWTVLERIKTMPEGAALPVLVVTIDDDRQRALALGACEHMVKPVDRDRLTAAVVRYALPKRLVAAAAASIVPTPDVEQFG